MPLLHWNTLDDAASSLSELTGEAWSPRRTLSTVLDVYGVPQGGPAPRTCLRCALPRGTKFGRYTWDAERGTPGNPFVFASEAPYQTVPLYPNQVAELLMTGETTISIAERPEDDYGRAGEYVFVEPMEQALTVGVSSIGMNAADLQAFAARVLAVNKTPGDSSAPSVEVSEPSARPADMGLSKRERQIQAIEATAETLSLERLNIPEGGKQQIKAACKKSHPDLFGSGDDPFIKAWQQAVKQRRIRMSNHDTYSGM